MAINLATNYMGLSLRNPLIAASCGLTASVEKITALAQSGIGAIVLKSLFEEQINNEAAYITAQQEQNPETADYIAGYLRGHSLANYLQLIKDAKQAVDIPVIASISCVSNREWVNFATEIEKAGADGLEINIFSLPLSQHTSTADIEKEYIAAVSAVCKATSLPIAVKIGVHFTCIPAFVEQLYAYGAKAVVMFNKPFLPDIDLEKMQLTGAKIHSHEGEYTSVLRWTGIVSAAEPRIDIAASTGVHTPDAAIKLLLAGASAIELCSVLYKKGQQCIPEFLAGIQNFMEKKGFESINDFRGILNYRKIANPLFYERTQFMKYFGGAGEIYN